MRSVVVVLPASMWAMMPMFLQRSNGTVLDTAFFFSSLRTSCSPTVFAGVLKTSPKITQLPDFENTRSHLPPVMRKGLVGLRHTVNVFFLLDGRAPAIGRIQQLVGQLVDHSLFRAATRIRNQPTDSQRGAPVRIHFNRHLVVRAANPPGFHFEQRLAVLDRLLEELQRLVSAFLLQASQSFIKDALGRALLARPHHRVNELCHQ